jgi:hypothetical protein
MRHDDGDDGDGKEEVRDFVKQVQVTTEAREGGRLRRRRKGGVVTSRHCEVGDGE